MDTMAGIMEGLRKNPLTEIAGNKVASVTDYEKPEETGLPAANVLIYKLENNETVIVRPSGTEPKIKIYYTTLGKDLAEAEAEKEKLAEALKPIMAEGNEKIRCTNGQYRFLCIAHFFCLDNLYTER